MSIPRDHDDPILLDADPAHALATPTERRVLGRDPFAGPDPDAPPVPSAAWLDALDRFAAGTAVPEPPEIDAASLDGVGEDWIDQLVTLLGERDQARLATLRRHLAERARKDAFGLSVEAVRSSLPVFTALHRFYFRVQSEGQENLPREGPVLLAANHGGLLPFDGAMIITDLLLRSETPRIARALVDPWVERLPIIREYFRRVGQVNGTRENLHRLLDHGDAVLVFPEGVSGIKKEIAQRYQLQRFHWGFVRAALRRRVPVVPVALIGADDQAPVLYDIKPLARRLGLPVFPITPTFPWLGPLGLIPYPVRYHIIYGEPFDWSTRYRPEEADDEILLETLSREAHHRVQRMVDRHRSESSADAGSD